MTLSTSFSGRAHMARGAVTLVAAVSLVGGSAVAASAAASHPALNSARHVADVRTPHTSFHPRVVGVADETTTVTTGGETPYTVPDGVTMLRVSATGAPGGWFHAAPGLGATLDAVLPVTPGQVLYLEVGTTDAGFDAPSSSGGGGSAHYAGTGGGFSAIQTCSVSAEGCLYTADPQTDPRLVVAGGGGGGGETYPNPGGAGGNAGVSAVTGPGAGGAGADSAGAAAGGDAGLSDDATGAAAGAGSASCSGLDADGGIGTASAGGRGGDNSRWVGDAGSGGGAGGGWVGGSGGGAGTCGDVLGAGGGGGAGASHVDASATEVSMSTAPSGDQPGVTVTPLSAQAITFTSTAPMPGLVDGSYTATATGGDSGNPVVFSTGDRSKGSCSVAEDGTVTFEDAGQCVVLADQTGSSGFRSAPTALQRIQVRFSDAITFPALHDMRVGDTQRLRATTLSGRSVDYRVNTPHKCEVDGSRVTALGHGTCRVTAGVGRDRQWNRAAQQQSLTVATRR